MAKANKVEVQKGEIVAHQPTQHYSSRLRITVEDMRNAAMRNDMQSLNLHMPKQ